jgi:hypothetical protein
MLTTKQNIAYATAVAIKKLHNQDFFDADNDELIDMISGALVRNADDFEHITRMLNLWVEETRKMLHPADVRTLAVKTTNKLNLPAGCDVCRIGKKGSGEYLAYVVKGEETGAERCECARGQRLKEIDAARAQLEKAKAPHAGFSLLNRYMSEAEAEANPTLDLESDPDDAIN